MLSRVIGVRDTGGVVAQPFVAAPLSRAASAPPGWTSALGESVSDSERFHHLSAECARVAAENTSLATRASSLETELAATKREAFEAGCRQGEQRARLELTPVMERMNQSIADTLSTRTEARRRAERDVVQLSLLIAKRVLHREIATDPNALNALARVVFERMARSESYTLVIHPQFVQAIQSVLSGSQIAKVKIEADASCAPGTFVVRSPEGSMDASIDTQLEEIGMGLADRLADA